MAAPPTFVAAIRQTATPWAQQGTVAKTTPSFSVTAGDVLVVLAAMADANDAFSATPSGGSLTWTLQENVGTATTTARAGIWTATASSTTSITVTMSTNNTANCWGFVVYQWRGSDGVGAHTSQANATSGVAPSLALTTAAANSAICYINGDWTATDGTSRTWRTINSITPTSGNGLETDYFRDAGGVQYTLYAGYWSDADAAGSKTTGLSAPTQRPAIAVIEIKGSAGVFSPSYTDWPPRQRHPKMRGAT